MERRTATKVAVVAGAMVGSLALAGTASGGKVVHKLSGPVTGDPNAKISIEVVVKNGEPKRIRNLKYKDLDAHCNVDGTTTVPAGELSGNAGKNVNAPGIELELANYWLFQWFSFPNDGAREVDAHGKIRSKGKKVVGIIDVYQAEPCAASTRNRFKAT